MLTRIMRLDRCNPLSILLSLLFIIVSIAGTYLSVVVTGWAMLDSSYMLKYSIKGYYIISIKISKFKGYLPRYINFL
jgi:hypothetical protein